MNFMQLYALDLVIFDEVDDFIDEWHEEEESTTTLHEHLGLTVKEYERFIHDPEVLKELKYGRIGTQASD